MLSTRDLIEGTYFLLSEDIRAEAERGLGRSLARGMAVDSVGLLDQVGLKSSPLI